MDEPQYDMVIAGGGLAGGLIALALAQLRPKLRVALFESGRHFGGNHIWSFFDSDIAPAHRWLVAPLVSHGWSGYDVRFPGHSRRLSSLYYSIESERLDQVIREKLPAERLFSGVKASAVGRSAIVLENGRRVTARCVIDARGPGSGSALRGGWQKFCGQLLEIDGLHGIERPVVMDATVDQHDGYRFVYLLPFGLNRIFVEDTYYSDHAEIDRELLRQRIADYAAARNWTVERVEREEFGVLPVLTGGDFEAYWRSGGKGVAKVGARAALFHPVTSYSLPDAVRTAIYLTTLPSYNHDIVHEVLHAHAAQHWRKGRFYRMIDKMLFNAAAPDQRYRILERFYRLPEELIERFYAGQTSRGDMARILAGRPPVPIGSALKAIMGGRT